MFGAISRFGFWMVGLAVLVSLLAGDAHAQPTTYLPWDYGRTYRVTQGNWGGWSHYDQYNRYAWDFAIPHGTPVRSAAPGTVRESGWNGAWGLQVLICYADGTCSRYAHLSAEYVSPGQPVGQGTLLGRVGSTGNSSAPHLHYTLDNGFGLSLPSRFAEAGVPRTGQRVTSRNRPRRKRLNRPTFTDIHVYSSDTLRVAAGDAVNAVVTARYRGPWKIPCGYANLGVRDDAPARFADYRAGFWPGSPWRSRNRAAANGCRGNLDPGESVHWELRFYVPPDTPNGTYLTGIYGPVHEHRMWSGQRFPISLRVSGAYEAERLGQVYWREPLRPGDRTEVSITFRNTGAATWYPDGPFPVHFRASHPPDRQSALIDPDDPRVYGGRQGVKLPHSVAPDETVTFTLPIKVSSSVAPGEYKEYFRLVAEHRTWFGSDGIYWPFRVSADE